MRVGDKVVCIKTIQPGFFCPSPIKGRDPKRGDELTVRCVFENPHVKGEWLLLFDEVVNQMVFGKFEQGYDINKFRKIDTHPELSELTDEDILQEIEEMEIQTA